jgi:Uncharacterized conserved protein (COG2071)
MRLPSLKGMIRRRILVNFRASPDAVGRLLPPPFRPQLHACQAIVGICLIRLEQIRPSGLPAFFGWKSENAAHRIAVEWTDADCKNRVGVFIVRGDTNSLLNIAVGGRLFPGQHHRAKFEVQDRKGNIDVAAQSADGQMFVRVQGSESRSFPETSCFQSLEEASAFFQAGSLGYSASRGELEYDGLVLQTLEWNVRPLEVREVESSYFSDRQCFPAGSIEFDHALVMRNISHLWFAAPTLTFTSARLPSDCRDPVNPERPSGEDRQAAKACAA